MAMILSNWIGPLIELELRNAMNSRMKRDGGSMPSSSAGEINSSPYSVDYQYDKSSLRVNVKFSANQPEHVQIREVRDHIRERAFLVSDGTSEVQVRVSKVAAQIFEQKRGKSIHSIQRGELAELLKFTIFVPLRSSEPEIHITVSEFNITVSIPQPQMGSPRDIDKRPGIKELIAEILGLHDPSDFSSSIQEQRRQSQSTMPVSRRASLLSLSESNTDGVRHTDVNEVTHSGQCQSRGSTPQTGGSSGHSPFLGNPTVPGMAPINVALPSNQTTQQPQGDPGTPIIAQTVEQQQSRVGSGDDRIPVTKPIFSLNWNDLKRLTRRICVTPRNQEHLLNAPESWLPPAPGKRFPDPNVPIEILEKLTAAVTVPENDPPSLPTPLSSEGSGEDVLNAESEEEDVDKGSVITGWSQSVTPQIPRARAFPELPPDSSAITSRGSREKQPLSSPLTSPAFRMKQRSRQRSSSKNSSTANETAPGSVRQSPISSTRRLHDRFVAVRDPVPALSPDASPGASMPKEQDSDDEMEEEAPQPLGPLEQHVSINSTSDASGLYSTIQENNIQVNETPYNKAVEVRHLPVHSERSNTPPSSPKDKAVIPSTYGPQQFPNHSTPSSSADDIRTGEKRALTGPIADASRPKRVRSGPISYGFSQEDPISQDPAIQIREQRRQFLRSKPRSSVPSAREEIFQRFKSTYPEYQGDMRHFQGVCTIIDEQEKAEKMEHNTFWDDFIIQHKLKYIPYVESCMVEIEAGGDVLSYLRFWRQRIETPRHLNRVMNFDTLQIVTAEENTS